MKFRRRRGTGSEQAFSFTIGCWFALVVIVAGFVFWMLGEGVYIGLPYETAAVATPVPAAPIVVARVPGATPTRVFVEERATMAPGPAITATTVVIVVVQPTPTPAPPSGVQPPLLIVVTAAPKP
jgi:hypothetical protein